MTSVYNHWPFEAPFYLDRLQGAKLVPIGHQDLGIGTIEATCYVGRVFDIIDHADRIPHHSRFENADSCAGILEVLFDGN